MKTLIENSFIKCILLIIISLFMLSGCKENDNNTLVCDSSTETHKITESVSKEENDNETTLYIYVYVCGAVKVPGVYQLAPESRMYKAIEMAGGTTENADTTVLNLAENVKDGERIYIPTYDETISGVYKEPDLDTNDIKQEQSELVNINTADSSGLMKLPGIGQSRADAIIAYREENGKFTDITEIMNVSGIKEAAFNKIKDKITI